jgi:nitroimidazol reductase NimA-like FMN-containing flavoprotein (pyridoxamine 5'-phosphate oxidase superfamily)
MRRNDREIKEISEIEDIISRSDVCRIAFAENNTPYIVTMNFGYSGGEEPCLYFHCAPQGRKLEMMRKNNFVCFEMDTDHKIYGGEQGCDWGMNFSSVVGYGNLSVIDSPEEKIKGLDIIMAHYSDSSNFTYDTKVFARTAVLRLDITEMTGKKV